MTAMDNASKNASEMIEKLQVTYNRTRQAVITTELIEIISGAAAAENMSWFCRTNKKLSVVKRFQFYMNIVGVKVSVSEEKKHCACELFNLFCSFAVLRHSIPLF